MSPCLREIFRHSSKSLKLQFLRTAVSNPLGSILKELPWGPEGFPQTSQDSSRILRFATLTSGHLGKTMNRMLWANVVLLGHWSFRTPLGAHRNRGNHRQIFVFSFLRDSLGTPTGTP